MKKYTPYLILFFVSLVFISPYFFTHKLIFGADILFHYNRFYDAAMQIANGDFQYFSSMYGFQQSGRIVNAFYGPLFAYFQGLLVLVAGSWFKYQVLSNFILLLFSGYSMLILLKYMRIREWVSTLIAILFMSTYTVQYWIVNQGFTSWGAAFYPICLIPIIDWIVNKKFSFIKVALCVGLMTQIHLLSTFMLLLIYLSFYLFYFFSQDKKKEHLCQLGKSLVLYLLLTANIWGNLLILYCSNKILPPFVNRNMSQEAINLDGSYWLKYPKIFPILLITGIIILLIYHKKMNRLTKMVLAVSSLFFVLSTSLVPWSTLVEKNFPFVSLIQFPFRFFVPFTLLFLLFLALSFKRLEKHTWFHVMAIGLIILFSIQTCQNIYKKLNTWDTETFKHRHTYVYDHADKIKATFYSKDLSEMLRMIKKSTPDYLPIYKQTDKNKYMRYKEDILSTDSKFNKFYKKGNLTVKWESTGADKIQLPLVMYARSVLKQNGQTIKNYELTDIGTPIIPQHKGMNEVVFYYKPPLCHKIFLVLTISSWLTLLICFYKKILLLFK
ncbi:hypothetical protein [Enterococcus ratti]|uniref:Membrane protein n=1 Tax=Enterococcus ratti TaxID=150033 RepID=A0A1L8WAB6_9ENTE|nr:hypothetical protein [Enterococcus ratti]OJG77988.1 membrane protein [Enterococcus ratti]